MSTTIKSAVLDTLRASKILTEILGIKSFEMQDSGDNYVVFSVDKFHDAVAPITKHYGSARNETDPKNIVKRLVWDVKHVNGQIVLHQAANQKPLLIFVQN